ncbi:MAG TPA: anhydro-N-acetylmuramic acid kinase [Chryseosolibacter sp.]|nr:anhydro-N-acetylmuramic acid kinase [Chryseosolibacter sp.]
MVAKQRYTVIGVMSGTSLDGLDIARCTFERAHGKWAFKIVDARTVKYPARWSRLLAEAHVLSSEDLIHTDVAFGQFIGEAVNKFLSGSRGRVDFIASHGHTVFHQPSRGFTYQIGNGNAIHASTGLPVVYDFRSLDVIRGGEGAPLVPVGDKFLFHNFDFCLNLGGIANISMEQKRSRVAFDVCFCNMALNHVAAKAGKTYDKNGNMASAGEIDSSLLKKIDRIYAALRRKRPSLGREIFESQIRPLIEASRLSVNDQLATLTESAAVEIIRAIPQNLKQGRVLCTGGGAFNSFLLTRMLERAQDRVILIVPEEQIVKFKEAVVFAFLGVLRVRDEANCLRSVTGSTQDSSGGILVGF